MVGACVKLCLIFASIYSLSIPFVESTLIGQPRIINGKSASETQFPYTISLCKKRANVMHHMCGGTIISETFILTAAHCINPEGTHNYFVLAGSPYKYDGDVYPIKKAYIHQDFNITAMYGDIALIQLTTPIMFSVYASSLTLNRDYIGDELAAVQTGWGEIEPNAKDWDLKYNRVKTMNATECRRVSGPNAPVHMPITLCAYSDDVSSGICTGDSGGPLEYNNTLIGVASWSTKPCAIGLPDGYTRISYYIDWIEDMMARFAE